MHEKRRLYILRSHIFCFPNRKTTPRIQDNTGELCLIFDLDYLVKFFDLFFFQISCAKQNSCLCDKFFLSTL